MACVSDLCHLLWERLDCVGGAEPGGFDMVLVPELEQPVNAYGGAVDPPGDIGRVLLRAIAGIDPGQSIIRPICENASLSGYQLATASTSTIWALV